MKTPTTEKRSSAPQCVLLAIANEHGSKSFDELKVLTHEMVAYKRAWENRTNNAPVIACEDFFVFEEMIETGAVRKVFGPAFGNDAVRHLRAGTRARQTTKNDGLPHEAERVQAE
jgi:hypothetical protein